MEIFFCCLSVAGYISGGDLYSGELIIGGIFLFFIGRWVYKWERGVLYAVVFGIFDGSII